VLHAFGFSMSPDKNKRENVCYACKQIAKVRGGACCEVFKQMDDRETRGRKNVL